MGKGHGAHGELQIRPGLYLGGNAEGGADQKAGAAFAAELYLLHLPGQRLGGQELPLRGQDAEPGTFGDFSQNGLRLFVKTCGNLRRGRILRQPHLRQLQKLELTIALQPLFVFRCGCGVEFFLQLSHTNQGNRKHTLTSCGGV